MTNHVPLFAPPGSIPSKPWSKQSNSVALYPVFSVPNNGTVTLFNAVLLDLSKAFSGDKRALYVTRCSCELYGLNVTAGQIVTLYSLQLSLVDNAALALGNLKTFHSWNTSVQSAIAGSAGLQVSNLTRLAFNFAINDVIEATDYGNTNGGLGLRNASLAFILGLLNATTNTGAFNIGSTISAKYKLDQE